MIQKPAKGEMSQWAQMAPGQYFVQELRRKFPIMPASYKFPTLEESRENAERAAVLEYIGKLLSSDLLAEQDK